MNKNSIVINALLQYFSVSIYLSTHTRYRTLSSLPNPGRSKCVFIHPQDIKLYPLYRTLVGLSMYLSTHKTIKHYPLYRTMVGLSVYLSTHKAINLYPLYWTMVGLSMYLSTHIAIRLYTLYRAMVVLTVRKQSLYSTTIFISIRYRYRLN